jgi:hypothetical protein
MRAPLIFVLSVVAVTLIGCGGPTATGNDLGGVMSWSGQSPADAFKSAEAHCQKAGKRARITQIVPPTGDAKGAVVFSCD